MTSGGSNFNDFPENQVTKVRAVKTVFRQIGSGNVPYALVDGIAMAQTLARRYDIPPHFKLWLHDPCMEYKGYRCCEKHPASFGRCLSAPRFHSHREGLVGCRHGKVGL